MNASGEVPKHPLLFSKDEIKKTLRNKLRWNKVAGMVIYEQITSFVPMEIICRPFGLAGNYLLHKI